MEGKRGIYTPITLGSLYIQDIKADGAYLLADFPSSQLIKRWTYRLTGPDDRSHLYQKFTLRFVAVLGHEFALVSELETNPFLSQHWKKHIPEYPEARTIRHKMVLQDDKPIITVFPMEDIPAERHVVDPNTHYKVLLKSSIPEMHGVPHPRYMTVDNITFPAMVKVDQSSANRGNIPVDNKLHLMEALVDITERFDEQVAQKCVITEFIEGAEETYCCHFYVNKKGDCTWLGATTNISKNMSYTELTVSNWDEDLALQRRFSDSFMVPVGNYLHEKGYFGWVCLDIVAGPQGDFLVDVNARLAGSTPHVLLASHFFHRHSYPKARLVKFSKFRCTSEELLTHINELNENDKGKIIVTTILPGETDGCCSAVNTSIFGKTCEYVQELLEMLNNLAIH